MTADDDGLETLLRQRYLAELSDALASFATALGLTETEKYAKLDAISRLFVRYDSFPAFSTWRTDVLRAEIAETRRPEPSLPSADVRQAEPRLRAVQILGGERATKAEWGKLVAWGSRQPGGFRKLKGDDGKWNLTEAEMQEALR